MGILNLVVSQEFPTAVSEEFPTTATHDAFRGMPNSYNWVEQAAENVQKEGLVLALTLCATKTFTNNENLWKYAELAKNIGNNIGISFFMKFLSAFLLFC